jgi:hypothetical protein
MFENHPKVGANLVRQIPRLDDVASIIEIQRDELGLKPFDPFNIIQSGAQILKVATHYEVNIMLGKSSEMILRGMKDHRIWFNQDLVSSLELLLMSWLKNILNCFMNLASSMTVSRSRSSEIMNLGEGA